MCCWIVFLLAQNGTNHRCMRMFVCMYIFMFNKSIHPGFLYFHLKGVLYNHVKLRVWPLLWPFCLLGWNHIWDHCVRWGIVQYNTLMHFRWTRFYQCYTWWFHLRRFHTNVHSCNVQFMCGKCGQDCNFPSLINKLICFCRVIFGMLIALPITLVYYILLGLWRWTKQ